MIVIAKKGTRKIVKGARYEVIRLSNLQTSKYKTIYIKGMGNYTASSFSDIDGNPLPEIEWKQQIQQMQPEPRIEFKDLKIGDILVCKRDSYSTLMLNGKYRISDLKTTSTPRSSYNGQPLSPYIKAKVKFEGCNRYFEYSSWKFRKLSVGESRELHLQNLLEDNNQSYAVDLTTRRIDIVENKDVELIKALAKSILDNYRHELSVVEWTCQKSATKLKVDKKDFDKLLKMPLRNVLKLLETK